MRKIIYFLLLISLLLVTTANAPRTKSPEGASVSITSPASGSEVSSPVKVTFGITGMEVTPAGTDKPNSGHHHLIIDSELPSLSNPIPSDDKHMHFGKGQTEVELELLPGEHTLQLILGDHLHVPHDPPVVSEKITITVK